MPAMTNDALDLLLAPVEGDAPVGPDLEYDADFLALERAAAPKAERVIGDEVKAAEEPDWDKVAEMARSLLGRAKDLRAAVHLAAAWTRMSGVEGWAAGLGLVRGLLERYWDGVHPQLDAEDDDDPTARVNAVVPLGDAQGVLGYFQTAAFVQSPRLGRFSLRDLRIANGTLKSTAGEQPSLTEIEACCMDCPEEQLVGAVAAANAALDHARAIDGAFNEHVGTAGPDLKALLADIHELKKFLEPQLAKRIPQAADEAGGEEAAEAGADGDAPAAAAAGGRINGPQDVIRRIDELCDYYARCEPSSPIPLLLRRARRLVGMSFIDLLQDLAPGGITELKVVSGDGGEG